MGHVSEIHKSGVIQTTLLVEQSKKRGYMVMMKLSTMKKVVETVNSNWRSPIAEKIMEKWKFDEKELYYYRASANFVFIFRKAGKSYFLRFNEIEEKTLSQLQSEVNLLLYLKVSGVAC